MLLRLPGAIVRAVCVIWLVVLPFVLLPRSAAMEWPFVGLLCGFAALFTIVEYISRRPSLVEFREAPPFNRQRFSALFATVLSVSMIMRGLEEPSVWTELFCNSGALVGQVIDFNYSPARMMLLVMPDGTDPELVRAIRDAVGMSLLISSLSIISFVVFLRFQEWPRRTLAFNVWINLPTFDPTTGGDVVAKLKRDARFNIFLGFLLPFLVPAVAQSMSAFGTPLKLHDMQTLIWTITAWTFLPASMLMRGVALSRVAQMIDEQRRSASARRFSSRSMPA